MSRSERITLAALVALFTAWHLPLMFRVAAGQDEDFYAVPGITILQCGLPQIPYIPSRDPETVYYHADELLYTLPPLQFYIQAVFHALIGAGLGAARMTSFVMGLITVVIVFDLSRTWLGPGRGAIFSAGFYLFSRAFYFPATMARPDMTATLFGVLAVWFVSRWTTLRITRFLIAAGLSAGASMLSHPLGLVPSLQIGIWVLARSGSPRSGVRNGAILTVCALGVMLLWIPLILLHPDWVEIQFVRNIVMRRAGPNAGMVVQTPWKLLEYQARCLVDCFNPIQTGAYLAGLAWSLHRVLRREPRSGEVVYHVLASFVILILLLGRHSIRGYYAYPCAFASIAVGGLTASIVDAMKQALGPWLRGWSAPVATGIASLALAGLLVPGSGIRTLVAHARHADDPSFDASEFARWIMQDIPDEALVAVDQPFVLDFYLHGRRVLDALIDPYYIDIRDYPFDYVVVSHNGQRRLRSLIDDLQPIQTYGDPTDEFGNFAVLYRRKR